MYENKLNWEFHGSQLSALLTAKRNFELHESQMLWDKVLVISGTSKGERKIWCFVKTVNHWRLLVHQGISHLLLTEGKGSKADFSNILGMEKDVRKDDFSYSNLGFVFAF